MGRVLTNNTGLAYCIETELGTPGNEWVALQRNSISTYGAEIATVAREPVSKDRQRRKGTVTDVDSAVEFEHDVGLSVVDKFAEGFAFATGINYNQTYAVSAVSADGEFTVPALTTAQTPGITGVNDQYATLFYGRGFSQPGNNGLWYVEDAAATGDTQIDAQAISNVTNFTAETNSEGVLDLAGVRFLAGSGNPTLSYDTNSKRLTITVNSTATSFDWAEFGITPGMLVAIGQVESNGHPSFKGYGRVVSEDGRVLVLDKVSTALRTQSQITDDMDVYFGKFVRNVSVDDPAYIERSFQFEVEYPNLFDNNATGYHYAIGNYCNTMAFNLALADKATMTLGFIGIDTENPTATRKTGAGSAEELRGTEAFNTSADIARLRVAESDEDGISTDFKSLTITLNNNVSAEKVLGTLGARFMNTGQLRDRCRGDHALLESLGHQQDSGERDREHGLHPAQQRWGVCH